MKKQRNGPGAVSLFFHVLLFFTLVLAHLFPNGSTCRIPARFLRIPGHSYIPGSKPRLTFARPASVPSFRNKTCISAMTTLESDKVDRALRGKMKAERHDTGDWYYTVFNNQGIAVSTTSLSKVPNIRLVLTA